MGGAGLIGSLQAQPRQSRVEGTRSTSGKRLHRAAAASSPKKQRSAWKGRANPPSTSLLTPASLFPLFFFSDTFFSPNNILESRFEAIWRESVARRRCDCQASPGALLETLPRARAVGAMLSPRLPCQRRPMLPGLPGSPRFTGGASKLALHAVSCEGSAQASPGWKWNERQRSAGNPRPLSAPLVSPPWDTGL